MLVTLTHHVTLVVMDALIQLVFLANHVLLDVNFLLQGPEKAGIADPICTFIFSVLVLFTTATVLRDSFLILMEGECCIIFSLIIYPFSTSEG